MLQRGTLQCWEHCSVELCSANTAALSPAQENNVSPEIPRDQTQHGQARLHLWHPEEPPPAPGEGAQQDQLQQDHRVRARGRGVGSNLSQHPLNAAGVGVLRVQRVLRH